MLDKVGIPFMNFLLVSKFENIIIDQSHKIGDRKEELSILAVRTMA
jgi:hypothetical protein